MQGRAPFPSFLRSAAWRGRNEAGHALLQRLDFGKLQALTDPFSALNGLRSFCVAGPGLLERQVWEKRLFGSEALKPLVNLEVQLREFLGALRKNVEESNGVAQPAFTVARGCDTPGEPRFRCTRLGWL